MSTLLLLAVAAGCNDVALQSKPIRINSDPNQERLLRTQDRVEEDSIDAFILDHPELDDQTKKELRDGTITRTVALERLKRQQQSPEK